MARRYRARCGCAKHAATRRRLSSRYRTYMASTEKIEVFLSERRNVVVAGIRRDGRPHLSPNWFHWDGERFYVSTTRSRVKYKVFQRDPRAELLIDDPA